jgi:hypothetical protein
VEDQAQWSITPDKSAAGWVDVEVDTTDEQWPWSGYLFRVTFDGGELVNFSITRSEIAAPLTTARLQRVPLGAIERCARSWITGWGLLVGRASPLGEHVLAVVEQGPTADRQRALAEIAAAYVESLGERDQRNALAKLLAERQLDCSLGHIPNLVREARDAGLLLPRRPGKGRQVGYLSNKARVLLGLQPSESLTAWERATDEDRAWAVAWEKRVSELDRRLSAGELTRDDYRKAHHDLIKERFPDIDEEDS